MTLADSAARPTLQLLQGGKSDRFDVEAALSRLLERLASHSNPGLPLMSRTAADKALDAHEDCDLLQCSTLVAAQLVIRDNYRWFRERGM
ncbi:hypothetical protein [Nocardia abscessus]|uniref:hypothetical protein n=1 Tax=Nocardia abscessus TaxID=120957 RepID=UPI0002E2EC53|nr:hypothetical protein [Nocardia abscessus]MCC3326613.1 hypothetical protein [Nocardia abscessus]